MKEIKFKIWDKENKVMGHFPDYEGRVAIEDFRSFENYYPFGYVLKNDSYKVMQYTGVTDCNNKEIYEGDIVKLDPEFMDRKEVVVFKDGIFGIEDKLFDNNPIISLDEIEARFSKVEKIGNKYKDKDLLK